MRQRSPPSAWSIGSASLPFTPATGMNLAFMASDAFGELTCQKAFVR